MSGIRGKHFVMAMAAVLFLMWLFSGDNNSAGTTATNGSEESTRHSDLNADLVWQYSDLQDDMGRGSIKQASVQSVNVVNFDFPYAGMQRATLVLRVHPVYGKDVILRIEKGQFLCGIDSCSVNVRFDDGKVHAYRAVEPADHSTTALFLRGYERFVAALRKSNRVSLEAQFYQEGYRIFQFRTSGLQW